MTNKLFILNFESGLWIHAATEAKIAQQAAKDGWEVATINCDGFLKGFCSVRASRNRTVAQVTQGIDCKDCLYTNKSTSRINQARGVANIQIGKLLSAEHLQAIKLLLSEAKELDNPLDFEYSGMKLGRIASHETMLRYKQIDASIPPDGLDDYFLQLEDCLRVFFSFSILLADLPFRSVFIIRNTDYASHRVFALLAEKNGHLVIDLREPKNVSRTYTETKITRFRSDRPIRYLDLELFAENYSPYTATDADLTRIKEYLDFLGSSKGFQVYSSKVSGDGEADIRAKLNIPAERKIFLLALSSSDEVMAIKTAHGEITYPGKVFSSQLDMVKETVNWAKQQKHVSVVIRPHPREASHGRNREKSKMLSLWESVLVDLPENVVLNHPSQKTSLYDLVKVSDAIITGWSSAGLEACLLGKLTILYDETLPSYPSQIALAGNSKESFLENLDVALRNLRAGTQASKRDVGLAWMVFQQRRSVRVPGRFFSSLFDKLPRSGKKIVNGVDRYIPIVRVIDCRLFQRNWDLNELYSVLNEDKVASLSGESDLS